MKHMLEEGGMRSLWRGNGMNIVKVMPEMALKFMTYDQVSQFQQIHAQILQLLKILKFFSYIF